MNARDARHTPDAGYSLTELLTAMGLAAILFAVAAPQLPMYWAQLELSGSAKQIAIDLQRARMKAVAENAFYRLAFSPDGTYVRQSSTDGGVTYVNDGTAVVLPLGIQLTGSLPRPTFNRLGTATADAAVTLQNVVGATKTIRINTMGNTTIS